MLLSGMSNIIYVLGYIICDPGGKWKECDNKKEIFSSVLDYFWT